MQYRKKPVVIEAIHALTALDHVQNGEWDKLPKWLRDAYEGGTVFFLADAVLIKTLEGDMRAERSPSDMIIRGVKGELYPCKPDIFAATYDAV